MTPVPKGWRIERDPPRLTSPAGTIAIEHGVREPPFLDGEVVTTCEGEYGIVAGTTGYILLDDSVVRVVGQGDATVAAAVREIVIHTRLYLGHPRRRPFRYRAPRGWSRVQSGGGDVTWLAPDHAVTRASLTVPRALPIAARAHLSLAAMLLDDGTSPLPTAISTERGLAGELREQAVTTPDGKHVAVVVIVVTDGVYDYGLRYTGNDPTIAHEVAASIEPLPRPRVETVASAFEHWAG